MNNNLNKWLCIGGHEHGKWIEQKEFHEVYPHDDNFLRPHTYRPSRLINPITKKEQTFYLLTNLDKERIPLLIIRALNSETGD